MSSSSNSNFTTGLVGIMGLSMPKLGDSEFKMYKSLINSRIVSSHLAEDKDFILDYSSAENFEVSSDLLNNGYQIIVDDSWRKTIKEILGLPSHPKKITLDDFIFEKIISNISISTDITTNISTIKLKSVNPELGSKLLEKVHNIADDILKERSLKRTKDYILFLNDQLSKTTKQDQRLSLISTLSEQQRSKMIASSNLSYSAQLFGKAHQSNSPTSPRIRNIILVHLAIGFFSGIFLSVIKYFVRISRY